MILCCARGGWRLGSLAILFAVGCSSGSSGPPKLPNLVPVTGVVTQEGKPLASATVMFHPVSEKGFHGAMGTTDESGKYELETDIGNNKSQKGAIPGQYKVTVSRLVAPDGSVLKFDPEVPPMNRGGRESIPMQYSTPNDMGLSFDVPAAGGKFDIEIPASTGP